MQITKFQLLCFSLVVLAIPVDAREISLDEALQHALNNTARGNMIRGLEQVAAQNYAAKRINFYLPEVSINGSLPSYDYRQRYDFFGSEKGLYTRRDFGLRSFIELKQSLLTGGQLTVQANLARENNRYPTGSISSGLLAYDEARKGFFDFSFVQPLLKPSEGKNDLNNKRDDMEIARADRYASEAALKKEVVEAYVGVLELSLNTELSEAKLRAASKKLGIDSIKFADGVISEEALVTSTSSKLDAELAQFETSTQLEQRQRDLSILLDAEVTEQVVAHEPIPLPPLSDDQEARYLRNWEVALPIIKARHEYEKSKRAADYAAAGHGLTGDLTATYSLGKEHIKTDFNTSTFEDDINTSGYAVSLNFRLPVFDGGAGSAAVKSARYQADQARLEFQRVQKMERAAITNLLNQIKVGHRRLEILRKQIALAENRLAIAKTRFDDGQVSEISYLDSKIFHLQARDSYLKELKKYLQNKIDLESKFSS